jgi:hypothetical protein
MISYSPSTPHPPSLPPPPPTHILTHSPIGVPYNSCLIRAPRHHNTVRFACSETVYGAIVPSQVLDSARVSERGGRIVDPPEGDHTPTSSRHYHLTVTYTLTTNDLQKKKQNLTLIVALNECIKVGKAMQYTCTCTSAIFKKC